MNVSKDKVTVDDGSCTKHLPFVVRLRQNLPAHLFAIATTAMFGLAIRPLVPGVSADAAVLWILLITGTSRANPNVWPINFSTHCCGKRQ